MAMPSFFGALADAVAAGERSLKCHWCQGWAWWPPEHELTDATKRHGRVFHDFGTCQAKEGEARSMPRETA